MFVQRLQDFIDHPYTKVADVAALVTSASAAINFYYPYFRVELHEWGAVFTDIAPIAAVIWLFVQIACKIIVTVHEIHDDKDEN